MDSNDVHVVGMFNDRIAAEAATRDLIESGIPSSSISAVQADSDAKLLMDSVQQSGSHVGDAAATGITSGAIVGGVIGLLVGAGLIFVGPAAVAAGPIVGLLTGGAAGAATGGFVGALVGLGIPPDEADLYAEGVRRGATLIVVRAPEDRTDMIHRIMDRDGAADIQDRDVLPTGDEPVVPPMPRIRTYPPEMPSSPTQTTGHAYADVPLGQVPPVGNRTDIENTMGGVRPRYGSLDDEENRQGS